jgi:cytochrome c
MIDPVISHAVLPVAKVLSGAVRKAIALNAAFLTVLCLSGLTQPAMAQTPPQMPKAEQPRMSIVMPVVDAKRGRRLFVTKGCFICHSVNGVGSKVAPALNAEPTSKTIDVTGFSARMWRGAPIMFALQSMELGYRVNFTAAEIADLAAFTSDPRAQEGFSLEEIPELVRDWIVRDAWWKDPTDADWRKILPKEFPDLENMETTKP